MSGFDSVTAAERIILLAFSNGQLVMPDVPLSQSEITTAIQSLKQRGFIKGQRPWRLTDKGRQIRRSLNANKGRNY